MSFTLLDAGSVYSTVFRQGPMVWAVWCAILAQKDADGVTPMTPEFLAAQWRMDDGGSIQKAWDVLAAPDPSSKNKEHEGRRIIPTPDGRWFVVSHEKYRQIHREAYRREQNAEAKRRQREREKGGARAECRLACKCGEPVAVNTSAGGFCEKHAREREPGEEG